MTPRTTLIFGAAAALLLSQAAVAAEQAAYPMKPVRMIVPVAPGGGADITARALAQKLTETWGQQVIIDNRAGAGGIVGQQRVRQTRLRREVDSRRSGKRRQA